MLEFAKTPPKGWNSWDVYGASVTEEEVKRNADIMAEKLKVYGWDYVVVFNGMSRGLSLQHIVNSQI